MWSDSVMALGRTTETRETASNSYNLMFGPCASSEDGLLHGSCQRRKKYAGDSTQGRQQPGYDFHLG